jgi:hypothetical protein
VRAETAVSSSRQAPETGVLSPLKEDKAGPAKKLKELSPISLAMTPTCDKSRVRHLRDEFLAKLCQKRFNFKDDNKVTEQDLAEHAVGIANFLFDDMMGPKAFLICAALVTDYMTTDEETLAGA